MRQLLLVLCAAALLLCTLPAFAEPSRAPTPPPGLPAGAELEPRAGCPPLDDNPFDEAAPRGTKPLDLNTADESALLALPGIGPARARAILEYREAHGGFRSISQLLSIRGIGRALLKQLRPLITILPR